VSNLLRPDAPGSPVGTLSSLLLRWLHERLAEASERLSIVPERCHNDHSLLLMQQHS